MKEERDFFAPRVFATAIETLNDLAAEARPWFLYVDSFEIHEPFDVPDSYVALYSDEDMSDPTLVYWPRYGRVDAGESALDERQLAFLRARYAATLTMTDRWLGYLLERIDDLGLWEDTCVILTTDHGFYLGEHGWVGKPYCPTYNVLAHTPLIIYDPALGGGQPESVRSLTAAVDVHATVLDALGCDPTDSVHGRSLLPIMRGEDDRVRNWSLYGVWGRMVNITDGEWTYMRAAALPTSEPLNMYSTGMMSMYWPVGAELPVDAEAGRFLPYADVPCWRIPHVPERATASMALGIKVQDESSKLFSLEDDPDQLNDRCDEEAERSERMILLLRQALQELEAPDEQFDRLGL